MNYHYYDEIINKNTIKKYDVTTIFEDNEAFKNLIIDLIEPFLNDDFNTVAGLESIGLIIGGAVALHMNKKFVAIRKGGKIPVSEEYKFKSSFVDYSGDKKELEIRKDSISKGDKVLIVDDWIETGTQAKTAIDLIEKLGGEIVGISVLCFEDNSSTSDLIEKYKCFGINLQSRKNC